jgi:hypothetical protein
VKLIQIGLIALDVVWPEEFDWSSPGGEKEGGSTKAEYFCRRGKNRKNFPCQSPILSSSKILN